MNKPKQFWITDTDQYTEHWIHNNEFEANGSGDFVIHVIDYGAYEDLEAKLKLAIEALESAEAQIAVMGVMAYGHYNPRCSFLLEVKDALNKIKGDVK